MLRSLFEISQKEPTLLFRRLLCFPFFHVRSLSISTIIWQNYLAYLCHLLWSTYLTGFHKDWILFVVEDVLLVSGVRAASLALCRIMFSFIRSKENKFTKLRQGAFPFHWPLCHTDFDGIPWISSLLLYNVEQKSLFLSIYRNGCLFQNTWDFSKDTAFPRQVGSSRNWLIFLGMYDFSRNVRLS